MQDGIGAPCVREDGPRELPSMIRDVCVRDDEQIHSATRRPVANPNSSLAPSMALALPGAIGWKRPPRATLKDPAGGSSREEVQSPAHAARLRGCRNGSRGMD